MVAAVKIIALVMVDRVKKLEMANMAAAAAIAISLHLEPLDIALRILFAALLNALVYLNNDYIDVELDIQAPDKDTTKARHLLAHKREAFWAQVGMTAVLAAAALAFAPGLLAPLLLGGGTCVWYSAVLKRRPFVDILAMMLWGLAMPLCGVPLGSTLGWVMAGQLGLFSGVFESLQVMRDADSDKHDADVRTTGVVLGKRRTLMLARGLMVLVAVYAALFLHPIAALLCAGVFLIPYDESDIARYWTRVKMTYGIAWLFICGWIFLQESSQGLLLRLAIDAASP